MAQTEKQKQEMKRQHEEMEKIKCDKNKMAELRAKAMRAASDWSADMNRERLRERKCYLDLTTMVIHGKQVSEERKRKIPTNYGTYPVAVIAGQYQNFFKSYTPSELKKLPVHTVTDVDEYIPKKTCFQVADEILDETMELDEREITQQLMPKTKTESGDQEESASTSTGRTTQSATTTTTTAGGSTTTASTKKEKQGRGVDIGEHCAFCQVDLFSNDDYVQCSKCSSSAHPPCLEMSPEMYQIVKQYEWECMECKPCSLCSSIDHEDKMLFCDRCDRGYHTFCVGLDEPPVGNWNCPTHCSPAAIAAAEAARAEAAAAAATKGRKRGGKPRGEGGRPRKDRKLSTNNTPSNTPSPGPVSYSQHQMARSGGATSGLATPPHHPDAGVNGHATPNHVLSPLVAALLASNEPPFICDICGKELASKWNLQRHLTTAHESEDGINDWTTDSDADRNWPPTPNGTVLDDRGGSNSAPAGTPTAPSAVALALLAPNDPPFICNECGREFSSKWNLQRHLTQQHEIPVVKPKGTANRGNCKECNCKLCPTNRAVGRNGLRNMNICITCAGQAPPPAPPQSVHTVVPTPVTNPDPGYATPLNGVPQHHQGHPMQYHQAAYQQPPAQQQHQFLPPPPPPLVPAPQHQVTQ